jgi:hypothetical protein
VPRDLEIRELLPHVLHRLKEGFGSDPMHFLNVILLQIIGRSGEAPELRLRLASRARAEPVASR